MHWTDHSEKNFLGRERELDILRTISSEARSGEAQSVCLSGKRGIGKSEFLRHLYQYLFYQQNDTIPFLYMIRSPRVSVQKFSVDYLSAFLHQSLSYLTRESPTEIAGIYSLSELRHRASQAAALWAVEMVDEFLRLKEETDELKLFSFAISAPYQGHVGTQLPVIVMIDDFHKIREFCSWNPQDDSTDYWILFERYLTSSHTPHIISGFHADIQKMLFEETSLGEHLDIMKLSGLAKDDSFRLFSLLCSTYSLVFDDDVGGNLDLFNGNPLYIKSFVQAARRTGRSLSVGEFWDVYVHEVTKGKIYTYWTSHMKTHVSDLDMRRPSLNVLQMLFTKSGDFAVSELSDTLSITKEELQTIITQLYSSGAVDMGFSTLDIADDQVLSDIITGLYYSEVRKDPMSRVQDIIRENRIQRVVTGIEPGFDVIIPSEPRAELVAIKSLEQIAQHYHIPAAVTGNLQVALVELFAGILLKNLKVMENYSLRFTLSDDVFLMEVETSRSVIDANKEEYAHILRMMASHLDDVRVEKTKYGTKVIMVKKMQGEAVSIQ